MPADSKGQIKYRAAAEKEGTRYQADPPMCNLCGQDITRENFGWAYLTTEGRVPTEKFEFIECTACTLIRESGDALLTFLKRHKL